MSMQHMEPGELAERLRVLRARRALSLTEASQLIGLNRGTLRDLENGQRTPFGSTLRKIARAYNIPVSALVEDQRVPLDSEEPTLPEGVKGPDPAQWGTYSERAFTQEQAWPKSYGHQHRMHVSESPLFSGDKPPTYIKLDSKSFHELLQQVRDGKLSVQEAEERAWRETA